MAKAAFAPLVLRLVHDGAQPGPALPEPLRFGLQDTKGEVHPGLTDPGPPRNFDLTLDVTADPATGRPLFRGAFAHGPPGARFLYLSWKRLGDTTPPYGWRIKIPLAGITWPDIRAASQPGICLATDVTGRRPHASAPIAWQVVPIR
jgi:hypothetical protein